MINKGRWGKILQHFIFALSALISLFLPICLQFVDKCPRNLNQPDFSEFYRISLNWRKINNFREIRLIL